jgi:hypothetical protein
MARYRIGYDMTILWTVNDRDMKGLSLNDKEVHLYYTCERGRFEVDCEIQGTNVVVWSFLGKDQRFLGNYTLSLEILQSDGKRTIKQDICDAFTLVGKCCEEKYEDGDAEINEGGEITLVSNLDIYRISPIIPYAVKDANGISYWHVDGVNTGSRSSGESAYEYAKTKGYEGTEEEFAGLMAYAPSESIRILEKYIEEYSGLTSSKTIEIMSLLARDQSLQFRFVTSMGGTSPTSSTLRYDKGSKKLVSIGDYIQHMTLGIEAIAPTHNPVFYRAIRPAEITLEDASKAYFVYIRTDNNSSSGVGEYIVSQNAIEMNAESGYYHLLTAIINSESNGDRSLIFLNGISEITPAQIMTPLIQDSEGKLVIDLENATISAKNGAKIIGDISFGSNSDGLENINAWQDLSNKVTDTEQGLIDTNNRLGELQNQIDGVVENYFLEGDPSVNKAPVTEWTTDEDKLNHVGDTYTNIEEFVDETTTPNAGKSWRWCECGSYPIETEATTSVTINSTTSVQKIGNVPIKDYGSAILYRNGSPLAYFYDFDYDKEIDVNSGPPCRIRVESATGDVYLDNYSGSISASIIIVFNVGVVMAKKNGNTPVKLHWHPIADTDALKALQEAMKAKEIADGKSRTFITQPFPPYSEGDLWVQGASGDILRCKAGVNKENGGSFDLNDWEKATKYTDDTEALKAQQKLNDWAADGVISPLEKRALRMELDNITSEKNEIYAKCIKYSLTTSSQWTAYNTAYTNYSSTLGSLTATNETIAIGNLETVQPAYYTARTNILDAIAVAEKQIVDDTRLAMSGNLVPNSSTIRNYMLPLADYPDGGSSTYYAKILLPIKVNGGETYTFKCENAQKLSGYQTQYRIRIDDGTREVADVTNVFSRHLYLPFGDNQSVTFTIFDGVVDKVAFLTIIRQESSPNNSRNDSILLNNVSLVRGATPMSVWEDYKGDAGLNNLLLIPEEVRDSSYNASWFYDENLPFTVKGGETYAISVDNLEKTGGTKDNCFAVICPQDSSEWLSDAVYISFKRKTWGILRIKDDVVSSTARLMIGKGEADNNLKLNITRLSLVRGPLPLMNWKESRAIFNQLSESILDAQNAINTANTRIDQLGVSNSSLTTELSAQKTKVEQAQKDLQNVYTKAEADGKISAAEQKAIADAQKALDDAVDALEKLIADLEAEIANDYGFLKDTFGHVASGDVFLAKMFGVGSRKGDTGFTVNGLLNGNSEISGTTAEGRLMLATGIPSTGGELPQRANNATTRIYEMGKINTNQLEAKGGHIGSLTITEKGVQLARTHGTLFIDSDGFNFHGSDSSKGPYFDIDGCENGGGLFRLDNSDIVVSRVCLANDKAALMVAANDGNSAIYCLQGVFSGLRPRIEYINSGYYYPTDLDHTMYVAKAASIVLPTNPKKGQYYKIIKSKSLSGVQISASRFLNLATGVQTTSYIELPQNATTIEMTYIPSSTPFWAVEYITH